MTFKIRRTSFPGEYEYSKGIIQSNWSDQKYNVRWTIKGGKEWVLEKLVNDHLLKCVQKGIDISAWEVIEVVHLPMKPINEWFDEKMLMKVLKK